MTRLPLQILHPILYYRTPSSRSSTTFAHLTALSALTLHPGYISMSLLLDLHTVSFFFYVSLNVFSFLFKLRLVCLVLFDKIQTKKHFCMRKLSFDVTPGFNLCALTVLYSMANMPYSQTIYTDVSYQFFFFNFI